MKVKKILSVFAAMSIAASTFAGFAVTANAAEPSVTASSTTIAALSEDFSGTLSDGKIGNVAVTSSNASINDTDTDYNSYSTKYLSFSDTSAAQSATIDISSVPYVLADNESVNIKFEYGTGNLSNSNSFNLYSGSQIVAGLNLGTWSSSFKGTIGGKSVDISYAAGMSGKADKYIVNASQNSHNNMKFAATVNINVNFTKSVATVSLVSKYNSGYAATFTGDLDDITVKSLSKLQFATSAKDHTPDRTIGVGKILATSNIPTQYAVTMDIPDESTITFTDTSDDKSFSYTGSSSAIVKNMQAGSYTYVVSKEGYPNAEGSLVVGADQTNSLSVELESATPSTLTLSYKVGEIEIKSALASGSAYVESEYVLTDTDKNFTEYTDTEGKLGVAGIVYDIAVTTDSVTPKAAVDTKTVACTATEQTYKTDITTNSYAQINITGDSTSGKTVNETVYSDASGSASVKLPAGNSYTAVISKGGYTSATGISVKVDASGAKIEKTLEITDENNIYYEDFDTAPAESQWFTSNLNLNGYVDSKKLAVSNTSGNLRAGHRTLGISSNGVYDIDFDYKVTKNTSTSGGARVQSISFRDSASKVIFGLAVAETNKSSDTYELYTYGGNTSNDTTNANDYNLESAYKKIADVTDGEFDGHITVNVNTISGKVTVTAGSNKAVTMDISGLSTTIGSLKIATQKGSVTYLDNIVISNAAGVIVSNASVSSAKVTNTDPAVSVEDASKTIDMDSGVDVYTIWYKVVNASSPKFTLKNGDTAVGSDIAITKATVAPSGHDNEGFYCVQILKEGLDAGDYTATITAGTASADVTFSVAE